MNAATRRGESFLSPHLTDLLLASVLKANERISGFGVTLDLLVQLGMQRSVVPVLGCLQHRQQRKRYPAYRPARPRNEQLIAGEAKPRPQQARDAHIGAA